MFTHRCRAFLRERRSRSPKAIGAENIPADADVVVIGNAIKRGNPEVEAVLNRKLLLFLAAGGAEGIFSARPAQSRRHRHTRKDDDDGVADVDSGRGRSWNPAT